MSYNGIEIAEHQVAPGESLSSIAKRYGFGAPYHWKPIFNINHEIYKLMGSNPNRLSSGQKIIIPRTIDGYRRHVRNLRALKLGIQNDATRLRGELERDYYLHQASRVAWDFAGDALTALAVVATKAHEVARLGREATNAVGRQRVAAEYLARREAEKLHEHLTSTARQTLTVAVADRLGHGDAAEHAFAVKHGIEAARDWSLKAGRSILDAFEIVLSEAKVSKVADWYLKLSVGSTPEQSYLEAVATVDGASQRGAAAVDTKISAVQREAGIVFGARVL